MTATATPTPRWPLPLRAGFRFVFSYLILYLFDPTGEGLPHTVLNHLGVSTRMLHPLRIPWEAAVKWTGEHVFGVAIAGVTSGASDNTYGWVNMACRTAIALAATLLWSWLDRRRLGYVTAHEFLRGLVRLYLVLSLLVFASVKAIPLQFEEINWADLLVTFGEQSPSGLLWRFMGASPGYTSACGIVEIVGLLLLLSRRTTLLGALLCAGALANVLALNLWYQVGVIIVSAHMLVMALFLIAPDARRLADLLLWHRAVPAVRFPPLFQRAWLERAVTVCKYGVFLLLATKMLWTFYNVRSAMIAAAKAQPLAGIWTVEEQELDGQVLPPLVNDARRWKYLIIQQGNGPLAILRPMSGGDIRFQLEISEQSRSFKL
ncbi:MAG: hypothetical protein ABI651_21135, partial [Verrucomicrobiota bacterium]